MRKPTTFIFANRLGQLNIRIPKISLSTSGLVITLTDGGITAGKSKHGFKFAGIGLFLLEIELLFYKRR